MSQGLNTVMQQMKQFELNCSHDFLIAAIDKMDKAFFRILMVCRHCGGKTLANLKFQLPEFNILGKKKKS